MIAADTSSWVAYLKGDSGEDVEILHQALGESQLTLPSPILTELLSDPKLDPGVAQDFLELPLLEPSPGFWFRAGRLRARVLARKRKARLGDALIAQLCVDHGVKLITRDQDFRAFAAAADLELLA